MTGRTASGASSAAAAGVDRLNAFIWPRHPGRAWFEWWYFKAVLPPKDAFYLAYGVSDAGRGSGHAFIAFGWPRRGVQLMERLPLEQAQASSDRISIAGNSASPQRIEGEVCSGGHHVRWKIAVEGRWSFRPTDLISRISRTSSIHWYPAQADARFSGYVELDGERIALEGVPGYQDHNWGCDFPRWWFWIACNAFDGHPDSALVAGGGRPRVLCRGELVDAVFVGLRHKDHDLAFRRHHFDLNQITALTGGWRLCCTGRRWRIRVTASAPFDSYHCITLECPGREQFHNHETLEGEIEILLERRWALRWCLESRLVSRHASIEYGTDPARPLLPLHRAWQGQGSWQVQGPLGSRIT